MVENMARTTWRDGPSQTTTPWCAAHVDRGTGTIDPHPCTCEIRPDWDCSRFIAATFCLTRPRAGDIEMLAKGEC